MHSIAKVAEKFRRYRDAVASLHLARDSVDAFVQMDVLGRLWSEPTLGLNVTHALQEAEVTGLARRAKNPILDVGNSGIHGHTNFARRHRIHCSGMLHHDLLVVMLLKRHRVFF